MNWPDQIGGRNGRPASPFNAGRQFYAGVTGSGGIPPRHGSWGVAQESCQGRQVTAMALEVGE